MKKFLLVSAAALVLAGTSIALTKSMTFEQAWQERVAIPLGLPGTSIAHADYDVPPPHERPACVLLDPIKCDKLQPIPNWQADNVANRLTGYGFPWINIRSLSPPVMAAGK